MPTGPMSKAEVLACLSSLRQHQRQGKRSPHKPLLVLFALGRLAATGSSALAWRDVAEQLGELIHDFGPPSSTKSKSRAAYPFTRLRSDKIWVLDQEVTTDSVTALNERAVVGRLVPALENALRDPDIAAAAARRLVGNEFPATIAPDVLLAAGLDPDSILAGPGQVVIAPRRRSGSWTAAVLTAWNRQCAFCGFDGQLGSATVGVEAAHVRWFNFGGPDEPDNGLALCSLHHKLFDHGAIGLGFEAGDHLRITVSAKFTSRTDIGQSVFELRRRRLRPRPGTAPPATDYVEWHTREVFKGPALAT